MAIFRGIGGAGDSTTDATVTAVTEQATNAANSATAAASSASSASTSASNASTSATNAAASAAAASTSETNAAASEAAASASETAAAASEAAAAASETAAAASEAAASTSETNAAASASAASTSATNAAASAAAASTSETNAAASESAAATSASNASTSATAASNAQTAAEAAQAAAEAAQEAIDGLYLGAQASDPTLDNNGDPVTAGDWYYNTTTAVTRIYDGSAWVNGAVSTAAFLLSGNNLSDLGDAATARTNLGLGTAATTASTDYASAAQGTLADSATQPGDNISTLTNDSGYLTSFTETNDLTAAVTWANVPDANITQSSVTQHQAALSITESQISDLGTYLTDITGESIKDLSDVYSTMSPTDGQLLTWDNANTRWDAQDAPVSLPDQSGHAGEYLTTDGTTASWAALDTDANSTTKGLYEHANTISANYTITSGNNAMSAGVMTINSGVTVTIPSGSRWAIV
jgi:chemotaxis protein histidine kinase CheA